MEILELKSDKDAISAFDKARTGPLMIVTETSEFNAIDASEYLGLRVYYFLTHVAHKIPTSHVGKTWAGNRWLYKDLKEYYDKREVERNKAMNELVALDQEMGLYE